MKRAFLLAALSSLAVTAYAFDPAAAWTDQCAKCHGKTGAGDTKTGKKLSIKDYSLTAEQAKFTDEEAFKAIKLGRTDASGKVRMKAIEGLTDADIKAMVAYFRGLKK